MGIENLGVECGKFDLLKMSQEDIIAIDDKLWVNSEVDERIIIYDNKPHIILKLPNSVESGICENNKEVNKRIDHTVNLIGRDNTNSSGSTQDPKAAQSITTDPTQIDQTKEIQKAVGAADLQRMGYQPQPVVPAAAIVPMKSNIKVYGPYASSNFVTSSGGISIETNPDLAPWVLGSFAAMHTLGNAIANNKAIGLVKAENGSATMPGLPMLFGGLGEALNSTGPNVTNISFSFGSGGISTTYQFSTFTPKFGSLTNSQMEKMKSIAKNRQEQLKFLRSQAILQNKIGRRRAANNPAANVNAAAMNRDRHLQQPVNARNTSQRLLIGEMVDFLYDPQEGQTEIPTKTRIILNTLDKANLEMTADYDKKAFMSLDGLLGPVSINGDGDLPRFANYEPGTHHLASPIYPQPPFRTGECDYSATYPHDNNNLEINQYYENPLTNKFIEEEHHHEGTGEGHVIDLVGRELEVPEDGLMTNMYNIEAEGRYSDDYRFFGLRGPLVLHAWGYDTEGKPIPNEIDTEEDTLEGNFITEDSEGGGLKERFLNNWLQKPKTWPVGPVDLRWDRHRGVWVSPPSYKIVVAKVTEHVDGFGSGTGQIVTEIDPETSSQKVLYDTEGNVLSNTLCQIPFCPEEWTIVNMGTPDCGTSDEIEYVHCIELHKAGVYGNKKKIKIPGVIDLGDITPCVIAGGDCTEYEYYLASACLSETDPQYIFITSQGTWAENTVIRPIDDSYQKCYTIDSIVPSGSGFPTDPIYSDGGDESSWTNIIESSSSSASITCSTDYCEPSSCYYASRCDPNNTIEYIRITRVGEVSPYEVGDVFYKEEYGCFSIEYLVPESSDPALDFTEGGNIDTWTIKSDCFVDGCSGPVYLLSCPILGEEHPNSTGTRPQIKLVDRIGRHHYKNDYVYAYYDTYRSEYIILESTKDAEILGTIDSIDGNDAYITVENFSDNISRYDLEIGTRIQVTNMLEFSLPDGCTAKGIVRRFSSDDPCSSYDAGLLPSQYYVKLSEYTTKPNVGEVYQIVGGSIDDCFTVVDTVPVDFLEVPSGATVTSKTNCVDCLSSSSSSSSQYSSSSSEYSSSSTSVYDSSSSSHSSSSHAELP